MQRNGMMNNEKLFSFLAKNVIFLPFLVLLLLFMVIEPGKIAGYPRFVDWHTVLNLTGMLLIVTAVKESRYIGRISRRLLIKTKTERGLAFALVTLSAVLSMFLTNDIALFITIPLTLGFRHLIKNDVKKLIIFQALAVNVGSALTPVGNPQNLFLWHQWGLSFLGFTGKMFPLFAFMALVLFIFVAGSFSHKALVFQEKPADKAIRPRLFFLSLLLLTGFIFSMEMDVAPYVLVAVALIYLVFYPKIFLKTDGMLLLLFVVMFIDFHLLSQVPFMTSLTSLFHLSAAAGSFTGSVFFSQWMSNVPAAIFVSKFSHHWLAVAYGVNVGGNGLVMASLANIIALRFARDRRIWIDFHKYSVPYLVVTAGLILLFIRW